MEISTKQSKNIKFFGEYNHTLDTKGRLALPAKFRAALTAGAVVTRGLDTCLFLYPRSAWEELAQKVASLPLAQANTRAFSRLMLAGAMEVSVDKQGRIILPDYLRRYAQLSKKVVLTGLYNRLEIWDETVWQEYRAGTEANSLDIAEALENLGV